MARKEKMKVYHGLPKSITDNHTLFYADFDGKTPPLLYEDPKYSHRGFGNPSPTGYALNKTAFYDIGQLSLGEGAFTIEFWVSNLVSGSSSDSWGGLVCIGKMYNSDYTMEKIFSLLNARSQVPNDVKLLESSQNIIYSGSLQTDNYLHIRVTYDGKQTVRGYVNGNLTGTSTISQSELEKWKAPTRYVVGLNIGHNYQSTRNSCYISDLHISNVDRGDYFPNLPQDFIEGKAIIKPRMGQQQIKGDPMYSQVTELKVPHYTGTEYDLSNQNPDNLTYKCFDHPELSTYGSDTWNAQSAIKIKGLNGELISGVVDTDTALAKVTGYPDIRTVQVDDISKIKVGDKFLVYYPQANNWLEGTTQRTVESIDTQNKTVTVTDHMGWNVDTTKGVAYILEVTASSSSPVVKTQDGTNVVGTWSGLGTNEATFTLGDNSNITGKDLYVTYSLIMPYGNSDFPQLPHTVERAYDENGIEMRPVTEIVIVDDFRGKISGSTKECPHISSYKASPSHIHPNDFSKDSFVDYNSIGYLDDSYNRLTNEQSGNVSRQLFSFNIIEMVERKFGVEIPGNNKVQWLKDNLDNYCKCTAYGYGASTSPMYTISSWSIKDNSWTDNTAGATHYNNFISPVTYTSTVFTDRIDKKGFAHFVVFTKASDGANPSILFTDYVSLEIKLKIDSTFTTFYRENKRAREDKCNPVLIQKETKTVKRYLPSKEPFVTESLAYPNSVVTSSTTDVSCDKGLYKQPFIYITNYGTATTVDSNYLLGLQPIIPKLPLNPNFKEHQFALGEIPIDRLQTLPKVEKSILVKVPTMMDALPNSSNQNKFYSEGKIRDIGEQLSKDLSMAVRFGIALVEKDGEMYMKIRSCVPNSPNYAKSTILSMSANFDMEYLYKLPTRPLIK